MNKFHESINILFKLEGAYVNDPRDPGGETKFGISKKAYPELDIPNLTTVEAQDLYFKHYWAPMKCDQLLWPLCLYVFDMGVNSGNITAIKVLQKSLQVEQDGFIGAKTIKATVSFDSIEFLTQRVLFYQSLTNYPVYNKGWVNRLFKLQHYADSISI